jgi:PRTRC genetic system protein F
MEIPTIPASVPDWYVYQNSSKKTAKLTLALIEMGIISEEDADLPTVQQSIEAGMARWFENTSAGINHLRPSLYMADNLSLMSIHPYEDTPFLDAYRELGIDSESVYTLGMGVEKYAEFCVNGADEKFEKLAPGLYSTALYRLYNAANSFTFMVHPRELQGLCSFSYWVGSDDESDYLEEMCGEGEEDEEYDVYKKADLEASLTPALLHPKNMLSDAELLALSEVEGEVGALAKAVLALNGEGWLVSPTFSERLNMHPGCMIAALRKNLEDDTQRIMDDYDQYLGECEDATEFTGFFFANPTVESLQMAIKGIESNCEMLRRVETVLLVMAEKTWPVEP